MIENNPKRLCDGCGKTLTIEGFHLGGKSGEVRIFDGCWEINLLSPRRGGDVKMNLDFCNTICFEAWLEKEIPVAKKRHYE